MAYRTADHERWKKMDFVVGIEIKTSSNHTCKGRDGKPHEFTDICDQLQGRYPKDFKFTGWHPHCRCFATSILKTDEEIAEDTRRILRGERPTEESENTVEDVPEGFKDWLKDNEERIDRAKERGTLPYFLKDNPIRVNTGGHEFNVRKKGMLKNSNPIGSRSAEKEAWAIYQRHNSIITLDQNHIDNVREIKSLIADRTKLSPMPFEDADDVNANIHNFDNGCVNAVFALEARRRGINCTSSGLVNEVSKDQEYVNLWTTKSRKKPSLQILKTETKSRDQEQIYAQLIKRVNELTKAEGTRYSLAWTDNESYQLYKNKVIKWGEVEGHIVYMERIGGKLLIHDEQGNTFCNLKSILQIAEIENMGLEILRLDNLLINTRNKYLSKVIELYP